MEQREEAAADRPGKRLNVGIPPELGQVIDQLKDGFPQLGITGRNDFVTDAVHEKIAATIKRLMEMRDLGLVASGDVERIKAWPRKPAKKS